MIYIYALPRAMPEPRDAKLAGEIIYSDRTNRVPQSGIDQRFIRKLGGLIRRIAAPEPPVCVPSAQECRFCDITATDCPERVETDPATMQIVHHRLAGRTSGTSATLHNTYFHQQSQAEDQLARRRPTIDCSSPIHRTSEPKG